MCFHSYGEALRNPDRTAKPIARELDDENPVIPVGRDSLAAEATAGDESGRDAHHVIPRAASRSLDTGREG
jgi:hypothetical protein